jgi:hypothetical protein
MLKGAFISILPNGNIGLIAQTVVCVDLYQRWINACNCFVISHLYEFQEAKV